MIQPKTVLVTGAEGALGSVVAKRFLAEGCQVIATAHQHPGDLPGARWVKMDLSDSASVKAGLVSVSDAGSVDALIHCAGGFRWSPTDQLQDKDLEFLIDANVRSAFLLSRELVPGMKERGFGRIVFVSSRATIQPPGAGMGAYAASKAALNQLTAALADEVRAFDINVNAVLPTVIDTPANRRDMPKADFAAWVKPEELAEILFGLTQPWAKPIHGALIPVSGRL